MTHIPPQNVTVGWRCFHCDEYFTGDQRAEAALHFGADQAAEPACKVAAQDGGLVAYIREQAAELEGYRAEDTELHRRIQSMICDHARELRAEEEKGYARGLRDGRALNDTPEHDPLYEKAVALVREHGKPQPSFVQRKLVLGYNRALGMIKRMEAEGIISPVDTRTGVRTLLKS